MYSMLLLEEAEADSKVAVVSCYGRNYRHQVPMVVIPTGRYTEALLVQINSPGGSIAYVCVNAGVLTYIHANETSKEDGRIFNCLDYKECFRTYQYHSPSVYAPTTAMPPLTATLNPKWLLSAPDGEENDSTSCQE
jgi:hypothetical protein